MDNTGEQVLATLIPLASLVIRGEMDVEDALNQVVIDDRMVLLEDIRSEHPTARVTAAAGPIESGTLGRFIAALGIQSYLSGLNDDAQTLMEFAEDIFESNSLQTDLALSIAWRHKISRERGRPDFGDQDWAIAVLEYEGEKALGDYWRSLSREDSTDQNGVASNENDPLLTVSTDPMTEAFRLELNFKNWEAKKSYERMVSGSPGSGIDVDARLRVASIDARSGQFDSALATLDELVVVNRSDDSTTKSAESLELRAAVLNNAGLYGRALELFRELKDIWTRLGDAERSTRAEIKGLNVKFASGPDTDGISEFLPLDLTEHNEQTDDLVSACYKVKAVHGLLLLSGADESLLAHSRQFLQALRDAVPSCYRLVIASYLEEADALKYRWLHGESDRLLKIAEDKANEAGYTATLKKIARRRSVEQLRSGRNSRPAVTAGRRTRSSFEQDLELRDTPLPDGSLDEVVNELEERPGWTWFEKAYQKLYLIQKALDEGRFDDIRVSVGLAKSLEDQFEQAGVKGGDYWIWARSCRIAAWTELGEEDPTPGFLDESVDISAVSPLCRYRWHLAKSNALLRVSDIDGSTDEFAKAVDTLEEYRSFVRKRTLFSYLFFRKLAPPLRRLLSHLLEADLPEQHRVGLFLRFANLVKGRTFDDYLYAGGHGGYTILDRNKDVRRFAIREQYIASAGSEKEKESEAQYLEELQSDSPLEVGPRQDLSSINEIQRHLEPGQAVLEMFYEGDNVHLFFLPKFGEPRIETKELDGKQVAAAIRQIKRWTRAKNEAHLHSMLREPWLSLASTLGGYIHDYCSQTEVAELYVVPHRELAFLPIAALQVGTRDGEPAYLGDVFPLTFLPSVSALPKLARYEGVSKTGKGVAFSDPHSDVKGRSLPQAKSEVNALKGVLKESAVAEFSGKNANLENFRSYWASGDVLLIPTHAKAHRNSYLSYLELHGQERLFSHDIFSASGQLTNTELVVLSACESGLPDARVIDETMGLMSSFLVAGAKMVLSTYWAIADQTTSPVVAEFLVGVVDRGLSPAVALSRATAAVRERHPHPYFWAPFFLMGRHRYGDSELASRAG